MDFSKVRLADFAQARLRDLERGSSIAPEEKTSYSRAESPQVAQDVCAHAPQYSVVLTPLAQEARVNPRELSNIQLHSDIGYALAIMSEGLLIWRPSSDTSLLFPLPKGHEVMAILVAAAAGLPVNQPGLVAVDCHTGKITYWESVNRAFGTVAGSTLFGARSGDIKLGRKEYIEFLEEIPQVGLVAATNQGEFFIIGLRDEVGKAEVRVHEMRAGSGLLARLRSMGAFAREITSIKSGRELDDNGLREVLIVNRYGDVAVWHVGPSGFSELVSEVKVGEKLRTHMNMLYPNSEVSLIVHDVAVEQDYNHILASFAPRSDSNLRYFVVMTLNPEFEVISVRRIQSNEASNGEIDANTSLQVAHGVLAIASCEAVTLLDSPSRLKSASDSSSRWEESLSLKKEARLLGSGGDHFGSVLIATSMGILTFRFTDKRVEESTTKARLEQAVFEGHLDSPLDLTVWPEYEAYPEADAPKTLALEIANATTPYVPAQLPNIGEHLSLRARLIQRLFRQAPLSDVRDIGQAIVAGKVLYSCYESTEPDGEQLRKFIDSKLATVHTDLREVLLERILDIPEILEEVSENLATRGVAHLILSVLEACSADGMGIPTWATKGALLRMLESLTSQSADARDAELLAQSTDMLCAVYTAINPEGADNSVIRDLLHQLSEIEQQPGKAIELARKYHVNSALAPLEVGLWIFPDGGSNESGLEIVSRHISELGPSYSTAVLDTCVSSGFSKELVQQLAPKHPDLVREYLVNHELYKIAWTLDPGSSVSTADLAAATDVSRTLDERRVYASLYKLSSNISGSGDPSTAQLSLDLVAAQESIAQQLQSPLLQKELSSSSIIKHGTGQMRGLLDRETAIDLLALMPPQAVPETNSNFIWGFRLVDAKDIVRQRLLVQQLVCNTNWERVNSSPASLKSKRLKQTLFYHTAQNVPPAHAAKLQHFRSSLVAPNPTDVKQTYKWDTSGSCFEELNSVYHRAVSIANKYDLDELVKTLYSSSSGEATMEVD